MCFKNEQWFLGISESRQWDLLQPPTDSTCSSSGLTLAHSVTPTAAPEQPASKQEVLKECSRELRWFTERIGGQWCVQWNPSGVCKETPVVCVLRQWCVQWNSSGVCSGTPINTLPVPGKNPVWAGCCTWTLLHTEVLLLLLQIYQMSWKPRAGAAPNSSLGKSSCWV